MKFTDSIENNLEVIRELLAGVPPSSRERAKKAAVLIENVFTSLQRDYPKDPAVALGAAFAVFILAERMMHASADDGSGKSDGGLIQLLQ